MSKIGKLICDCKFYFLFQKQCLFLNKIENLINFFSSLMFPSKRETSIFVYPHLPFVIKHLKYDINRRIGVLSNVLASAVHILKLERYRED
jgi:hypothetical protein